MQSHDIASGGHLFTVFLRQTFPESRNYLMEDVSFSTADREPVREQVS